MNNFDLFLLFIIGLSVLLGAFKGFFASLFSTLGWIISIYGNHKLFFYIEPFLYEKLGSKFLTFAIGYLGGLLIFLFFFAIINFLAKTFLSKLKLGFVDKILGGTFGLVRGLAIIVMSFLLVNQSLIHLVGDNLKSDQIPQLVKESAALPWMREGELIIVKYLPQEDQTGLEQKKILQLISKLISHLPPDKVQIIHQKLDKIPLPKDEKILLRLQKLWSVYKENSDTSFLTKEEIELIKRVI